MSGLQRALVGVALSAVACGGGDPTAAGAAGSTNDPRAALRSLALPSSEMAPPDVSNKWADDAKAAAFGQRLFFSTSFSGQLLDGDDDGSTAALGLKGDTGKVACAGCHLPNSGFSDSRSLRHQISLGAGWGFRRAPSILDVGQSRLLMWDGRHDALYNQVFGPIESAVEMNSSRLYAAEQVFALYRPEYEAIFGPLPPLDDTTRFPALSAQATGCASLDDRTCRGKQNGSPGDGAQFDALPAADRDAVTRVVVNVGKAIGAYERRLSCGHSPFDSWLAGDDSALTPAQVRGAALFAGSAKCISCHSGPFLPDEKFHNLGLLPTVVATVFLDDGDSGASVGLVTANADPLNVKGSFSDGDDGRIPSASDPGLVGAFRTPKLRCVADRPSFMHTGQLLTLDDVIAFKNKGGDPFGFPGTNELVALNLTTEERADLVAFMKSLTGPGPSANLLTPPSP